jgi:hypothetical protein
MSVARAYHSRRLWIIVVATGIGLAIRVHVHAQNDDNGPTSSYQPKIPRTWSKELIATFELPLARPEYSPVHVSESYYYQLPVRKIWKSYPIYHPDREPQRYREHLAQLEPEIVFDEGKLDTEQDWIDAGALVFGAPVSFDGPTLRIPELLDPAWYKKLNIGVTKEGIFPYARWVIREKGKLEVGVLSCAMCHTRLMPDGSTIEGAQGNLWLEGIIANRIRQGRVPPPAVRAFTKKLADVPWKKSQFDATTVEAMAAIRATIPPGVMARQGTSFEAPSKVPDLIGIQDRRFLDATGLVRHRGIGDLMRYAASNQTMDILARFGDFVPDSLGSKLPAPGTSTFPGAADRYSDAQLFALAKYLYSLEPPPIPHKFGKLAKRGKEVFEREDCARCHTPPHYTNNRLTPVDGFEVPADHPELAYIEDESVGTDPSLALQTRRGTGFYKVPSLRGLWYRGPLGHSGAVATLEDWFDSARLSDDYVPTGWKPAKVETRAVTGHEFGLDLPPDDKKALIAFLRTL